MPTFSPMPTTAAGPPAVSTRSTRIPATLRSSSSTSFGHFTVAVEPGRPQRLVTAYPVSSGSHGQVAVGSRRAGAAPRRSAPERAGVSQVRSSRPRPAVWCSATTTRPSRPAGPGPLGDQRVGRGGLLDHLDRQAGRGRVGAASRSASRGGRAAGSEITSTSLSRVSAHPGEGTDVPEDIDTHTTAGKLADLDRRLDEAVHAGSAKAVEKQHAKGRKTARERIEILFDEGSFVELDELARHRSTAFGLEKRRPYGDGVITGYGTIDGRQVCVFSQDFTIFGGSLGEVYGEKITKVMDLAIKTGCPIIGINEGAGARIQEGVVSLGLYGEIFRRNVHASGRDPPDQPDHGLLRRRPRLLPRGHRLHDHGRRHLQHVHHRPRRHQDRHRRGRHDGGARRRPDPQHQVRQRPLHGRRRGRRAGVHQGAALLPAPEQPRRGAVVRRRRGHSSSPTSTAASTP